MKDSSFLYDIFNLYYEKGMKAKEQKKYDIACKNFLKASEMMLTLAKETEGSLRKIRYEHAARIIAMAKKLKDTAPSPSKRVAGRVEGPVEDDTETVWREADIPKVSFDDVVGLEDVKDSVKMRIILPLQHPDIYSAFRKNVGGGILLYGPPGTGKTMIAQAIAHEVGAHFYAIKSSDIVSKWFGEAEKNVRNLFKTARGHKRAIIFFDEFEALATKRGGSSTVMNRLVPELLTQIQGFTTGDSLLLLLAATNRPWDIDSAMLRPGRFNELIYIPLPDYPSRRAMIEKNLTDLPLDPDISFDYLAEISEGFNGADIVEFCDRIKHDPIKRSILSNKVENITAKDVEATIAKVKSSVTENDLKQFYLFNKKRNITP